MRTRRRLAAALSLLALAPAARGRAQCDPTPRDNAATIAAEAARAGLHTLNGFVLVGIAACESALDERQISPTGHAGLFQFGRTAWNHARATYFHDALSFDAYRLDPRVNAQVAVQVYAHEGVEPYWKFGGPPYTPANMDPFLLYLEGIRPNLPCYCKAALEEAGYGFLASATCYR